MGLTPGDPVGRYVAVRPIGAGSVAEVWLVRHAELGSLHALKRLHLPDPDLDRRLLEEGRIQSTLVHPNVLRVTDVVEAEGRVALVLELVTGTTLAHHLGARAPVPIAEIEALADGILAGVAAAHAHGWVHRDLKPSNVLLQPGADGLVPKIADFGIARSVGATEPSGGTTRSGDGTRRYMSFEQLVGHAPDPRFDVFALGALLFELCTGRPAFPTIERWEHAIRTGEPPPLDRPELPERMVTAIAAALGPRAGRPADAAALHASWREPTAAAFRPGTVVALRDEHVAGERLTEPTLTADELAHLETCVRCRLERRVALEPTGTDRTTTAPSAPATTAVPALAPPRDLRPVGALAALAGGAVVLGFAAHAWRAGAGAGPADLADRSRWALHDLRSVDPTAPIPWAGAAVVADDHVYVAPIGGTVLLRHAAAGPLDRGWETFDAARLGAQDGPGASGLATDGRRVWVTPLGDDGLLLSFDGEHAFGDPSGWSAAELGGVVDPVGLGPAIAWDGRHLYLGPQRGGLVARHDPGATAGSAWTTFDLGPVVGGAVAADPVADRSFRPATAWDSAVVVGSAIYWVPHRSGPGWGHVVVRLDTTGPFAEPASWSTFDTHAVDLGAEGFSGGTSDGRWLYLAPGFSDRDWWSGLALRHDTTRPLGERASWETTELRTVDPTARGFAGAVFDGRFVSFLPYRGQWGATLARYDTRGPFDAAAAWSTFDLQGLAPDALAVGAGASDGESVYLLPYHGDRHGPDRPAWALRFHPPD